MSDIEWDANSHAWRDKATGAWVESPAAEIERLRAELETERQRLTACGVAALGYFEDSLPEYKSASPKLDAENAELRKQNDQLHDVAAMLEIARAESQKLKARLAWFEKREPLVRALCGQDAPAIAEYELLNPKPVKP